MFSSGGRTILKKLKQAKGKLKGGGKQQTEKDVTDKESTTTKGDVSNDSSSSSSLFKEESSEPVQVSVALFCFFIFYEFGFHSLSNLPLDNKLLFGIHARFWMQPNILLFMWLGIGLIWLFQRLPRIHTSMTLKDGSSLFSLILTILIVLVSFKKKKI